MHAGLGLERDNHIVKPFSIYIRTDNILCQAKFKSSHFLQMEQYSPLKISDH
jgi:hypothetical protein